MAFVICQQHGGHVAPLLCPHLREAIEQRTALPESFYVEAWYLDAPAWSNYICPICASENGITENPTIWRDDDSLDRLFLMRCDVAPACRICFDNAKSVG
jgi:hypothetical protein